MFIKNLDDRSTLFRMISKNIILFHFFLLCILISFQFGKSEPLYLTCNISSTGGSEYRDNLESLLSTLTSNGTTPDGFSGLSNVTANAAAYGLFLCRGDVSPTACVICVATAKTEVLHLCPNQTRANVFYDDCMLRYSDRSILSELDDDLAFYKFIPNATYHNMTLFSQVLSLTFDALARKAAYDSDFPGKKFAAQESNLTDFEKISALAQCTPDLSYLDCYSCLRKAISQLPGCCKNSMGARVIYPSCNIRYELYPFYQNPAPPDIDPPPPPDIDPPPPENNQGVVVGIAVSIGSGTLVFILGIFFWKRGSMKRHYFSKCLNIYDVEEDDIIVDPESLQYSLSEIETATNMFSMDNKIGQGGFGSVYKGILPNGQEVAVKRLSKSSGQGAAEFKNEIAVVAKLQHRNLVRLLGFCLEGNEKILVYEFVPRRSLDYFLFDFEKKGLLNWSRRHNIIGGIARGLLYLHEDSRLKIVHRDLKVGNILLDESMHPKIADFGMAKICGIHESEGNTTKIAGTFGYMAPEYTRSGQYSVKSDVFSFGVVLLEIITGRKNSTFYQSEDSKDLISHAWRQWRGGTPLALLDPAIKESYVLSEVIQCVHIGLLCVEEDANKRPTMTLVVCMLNSTSVNLPIPHHPAILRDDPMRSVQAESRELSESINGASFTEPYPR